MNDHSAAGRRLVRNHRSPARVGLQGVAVVTLVAIFTLAPQAAAITFGEIDTEHTNVGSIVVFSLTRGAWFQFCSGSLISSRIFLTAGHCTAALASRGIPPERIRVTFALDIFAKGAKWLEVSGYASHPELNFNAHDWHDLGVVILEKAVQNLQPVALPPEGYLDGLDAAGQLKRAKFAVVGYGTDENIEPTGVRMIALSEFLNLQPAWLYMSQNPNTGDSGTCFGDSGGPTFHDSGGGEILVAVTSWGDAVCIATGVNYRVDTASSLGFLTSVIAANA